VAYHNLGTDGFGATDMPQVFISRPEKMARHVQDCRHIVIQLHQRRARLEEREDAARAQAERQHVDELADEPEESVVDTTARAPTRLFLHAEETFLDHALSPQ